MKHISSNNWEILKGERIRRWPSVFGGTRNVTVTINSWVGISLGAKHINVTVEEEENQWWCEDENAWVSIYSDSTAKGYDLRASVYTEEEAKEVAEKFIDIIKNADNKTQHRVIYEIN